MWTRKHEKRASKENVSDDKKKKNNDLYIFLLNIRYIYWCVK